MKKLMKKAAHTIVTDFVLYKPSIEVDNASLIFLRLLISGKPSLTFGCPTASLIEEGKLVCE